MVNFEKAIREKTLSAQWPAEKRMALYGQAAWEAYWMGWLLGDQRKGRDIRWVYGPTIEHCGLVAGGKAIGCSDFEAMGWTPVLDFTRDVLVKGYAPRSGQLECHGIRCLCKLEERIGGVVQPAMSYPIN